MRKTCTTDKEFLESLELNGKAAEEAIIIRRVIARLCNVNPETIQAADDTAVLSKAMKFEREEGWNLQAFKFVYEEIAGRQLKALPDDIPPFIGWKLFCLKGTKPRNFGEWVTKTTASIT